MPLPVTAETIESEAPARPSVTPLTMPSGLLANDLNNLQEFLVGSDPTNGASSFHITGIVTQGSDVSVSWVCGGGKTATNYLAVGAATHAALRY